MTLRPMRRRRPLASRRGVLLAIVVVACAASFTPLVVGQEVVAPEPTTEKPTEKPTDSPTPAPPTPTTAAPTEAPTPTPTSAPETPTPTTPTPTQTPTLKPITSSSGSKDASKPTTPGSGSGNIAPATPVSTSKMPITQRPISTTKPSPSTRAPDVLTPRPTSTDDDPDKTNSNNNRDNNGDKTYSKSIAIIVVAGIAAVCALGLIVVCFLRRRRDDLDDMTTPLPQFTNNPPSAAGGNGTAGATRASIPMGPGAANYYPSNNQQQPKPSISTSGPGQGVNGQSGAVTSPTLPADYRGPSSRYSSRLTNYSRTSSRLYRSNNNNNSTFTSVASLTTNENANRMTGLSQASSFSVRYGSEVPSHAGIDVNLDRSTYNSHISSTATDPQAARATGGAAVDTYRFTGGSSMSSLNDSEDLASVVNRGTSASSVDQGYYDDPTLSQSIGGASSANWYSPVDSPTSAPSRAEVVAAVAARSASSSKFDDRESDVRGSFEL